MLKDQGPHNIYGIAISNYNLMNMQLNQRKNDLYQF